ncbi:hypothetical protein [Thiohalomonas denitrificans]|uniref:MSHA biogenesis protein MshJ n=1 Tax=Thiohalomonas denitrificans TaxID=415747 RepID=A0A1G5QTR4_9GAMM|nr:hypothetical protein [Thiohalomonas denitrificans]SCZ64968.1 MSHA biogenesis protein MshJ [Thiohalomonas denitrificans]
MKELKARIEQLRLRIDSMTLRERVLLFGTVVVVLFMAWDSFLMAPLGARNEAQVTRLETVRGEIDKINQQVRAILEERKKDPNLELNRDLARVSARVHNIDRRIAKEMAGLIGPQQMARMLEEVLVQQDNLKPLRIENLGSSPLVMPTQQEFADGDSGGVYRHRLLLEMEGGYLQTVDYLRALQALPWTFYWDEVSIELVDYPTARVRLVVSTLSLEENWIGT